MHEQYLSRAIELAMEKSADGRHGPFGAVITKNGNVISEGWNEVVSLSDPTAHAEISAIRKACQSLNTYNLSGCTIYTSCEPCPMCLAAIYWARINIVVFSATQEDAARAGFDDSFFYQQLGKNWEERSLTFFQGCHEEGKAVFEKWLHNPRKIKY